jgi:hypothetical protein
MTANEAIIERKKIAKKLRNISFGDLRNTHIIKKDGNRLGRRKYLIYSNMYFHSIHLKSFINTEYGLHSDR